jgi:hypothetical protein
MIEWNRLIKCPQCGAKKLTSCDEYILRSSCDRKIRLKNGGALIDLLPDRPPELTFVSSEVIKKYYYEQYKSDFFRNNARKGWGGQGPMAFS